MSLINPQHFTPNPETARWLDHIHRHYHHPRYISPDPLEIVRTTDDPADREIVALLAGALAYGQVKSILAGIQSLLALLRPTPAAYLLNQPPAHIRADLAGWRYRVTSGETMARLLIALRRQLKQHGSLKTLLDHLDDPSEPTLIPLMGRFVDHLRKDAKAPLDHLIAHPDRGSACKRLALTFRWLVREDAIDPGGWTALGPHRLLCPIDTHMHAVARQLGWTTRNQANLKTALEVTAALRAYAPDDPLKYDFALTRPGIRKEPMPEQA